MNACKLNNAKHGQHEGGEEQTRNPPATICQRPCIVMHLVKKNTHRQACGKEGGPWPERAAAAIFALVTSARTRSSGKRGQTYDRSSGSRPLCKMACGTSSPKKTRMAAPLKKGNHPQKQYTPYNVTWSKSAPSGGYLAKLFVICLGSRV